MYELIKDLNIHAKRFLISFIVVYCFVFMSLYVFKPEIINQKFYLPFIISFCLTFLWFLMNLIALILTSKKEQRVSSSDALYEKTALLSIFVLCISMMVAYYYSFSFTKFLRYTFYYWICYCFLAFMIGVLKEFNHSLKNNSKQ